MKKMMIFAVAAMLAALVTGCSSLETSRKFNSMPVGEKSNEPALAHLNVRLTGFYLFHCIPIFTGSVNTPGRTALFKDTVTVDYGVLMLTKAARDMGGRRIYDLESRRGGFSALFLFSWDTVEVSANTTRQ